MALPLILHDLCGRIHDIIREDMAYDKLSVKNWYLTYQLHASVESDLLVGQQHSVELPVYRPKQLSKGMVISRRDRNWKKIFDF